MLEADKQQKLVFDPVTKRVAQVIFHFNHRELGKHAKQGRTSVADLPGNFFINCPVTSDYDRPCSFLNGNQHHQNERNCLAD